MYSLGSLILVGQPVQEKESSAFKRVVYLDRVGLHQAIPAQDALRPKLWDYREREREREGERERERERES